jgi:hypothetical protein
MFRNEKSSRLIRRIGRWVAIALTLAGTIGSPVWAEARVAESEQNPGITLRLSASPSAAPSRPGGLMVAVIDRSYSMTEAGRWDKARADLLGVRLPAALKAAGAGGIDVRLYPFSDNAAVYSQPAKQQFTIKSAQDLARGGSIGSFVEDGSSAGLGEPYGKTALFGTLRAIAEGLVRERVAERYQWVYLVIYTDGDDTETRSEESAMCQALAELSMDHRVSIERVKLVEVRPLPCQGLSIKDGLIDRAVPAIPKSFSLSVEPGIVALPKAGRAGACEIGVRATVSGDVRAGRVSYALKGAPPGVSISTAGSGPGGESVQIAWTRAVPEGARFRVEVSVAVDGGPALPGSFDAVIPPLDPLPPAVAWGLPEGCVSGGLRHLLVPREAGAVSADAELRVTVPGATVRWWTDGRGPTVGASLDVQSLAPGVHDVEVQLESADGRTSPKERLRVCVFEPNVKLTVSPESPAAGDAFEVVAEAPIGLPDFLLDRLRTAPACWLIDGTTVPGAKGLTCSAPAIMRAGAVGVEFQWSAECGPQAVRIRGRVDPEVRAGPSIRLLTDRVTRGKAAAIEVAVEQPGRVHEVLVRLGERGEWVRAEPTQQVGQPWKASFPARDVAGATVIQGGLSVIPVEAMPILKVGDTGVPTEAGNPGNQSRRVRRTVALGDPDVNLELRDAGTDELLVAGSRLVLGADCLLDVRAAGQDGNDVASVVVTISVDGSDVADLCGNATRNAAEPRCFGRSLAIPGSGGKLTITAQALDSAGKPIGTAATVDVGLRPGRSIWVWSLIALCYLGFAAAVVRLTFFNTRLGQEYRWTKDKDGLDPQVQVAGTVGLSGEVKANLWTKAMSVEIPVDAIPGPEGDFKWIFDLRDSLGGALRFSIDRFDNTEGDGYRLNLDKFEHGPDAAGFRLRPPPALPGKRPGHPLFLNFFHQKGAGTRFLLGLSGFAITVGVLAAVVWLFMQDWF